jgi:hypothetical protein
VFGTCNAVPRIGVFLWGTAYKWSLYESSPIHNKVPEAKLLTDAGKATRDLVELATTTRPVTALPLLLDLVLFFFALSLHCMAMSLLPAKRPRRLRHIYFPPANFLRPPPFPLQG